MKQLFSKFLVAFLLTSAVVLSWSEYFLKQTPTKFALCGGKFYNAKKVYGVH